MYYTLQQFKISIIYTCVANKSDIIIEVYPPSVQQSELSNLTYQVTQVLDRLQDERDQNQSFFCMLDNNNVFLTIASSQFEKTQAHSYLKNIAQLYNDQVNSLTTKQLKYQIQQIMAECSLKNSLQPNINQAKTKLTECVELLLVRSEKLQLLYDQVEDLQGLTINFERHSSELKDTFWKRSKKYIIWGSVCVVAIIVLIVILICLV